MADQLHMPTSLSLVLRGLRCCFEPRTRQDRIASLGARLVVRRGKITRAAQLAGRISQIARESPEVHYPLGMLGGKVVLRCRFTGARGKVWQRRAPDLRRQHYTHPSFEAAPCLARATSRGNCQFSSDDHDFKDVAQLFVLRCKPDPVVQGSIVRHLQSIFGCSIQLQPQGSAARGTASVNSDLVLLL